MTPPGQPWGPQQLPPGLGQQPPQQGWGPQPQQGWGYGGYGAPPPAPPRKRTPWPWVIPLIVVVVAAAIVVPIVLFSGTNNTVRAAGTATGLATIPAASLQSWQNTGDQYNAVGAWTDGTELITATNYVVTAFDRASGAQSWRVYPPKVSGGDGTMEFCGASTTVFADQVSLGYGPENNNNPQQITCAYVTVLNLRTGKLGWSAKVATDAQIQQAFVVGAGLVTEIASQKVIVAWSGLFVIYSLADGTVTYSHVIGDFSNVSIYTARDMAVAGNTFYILLVSVAPPPGDPYLIVDSYDVSTGKSTGKSTGQYIASPQNSQLQQPADGGIISTSPLVVLATEMDQQTTAKYLVLNKSLQVTEVIDAGVQMDTNMNKPAASLDAMALDSVNIYIHQVYRALVVDGMLISVTSFQTGNQLVAYDLGSGQRRWSVTQPGTGFLMPVTTVGSTLIVTGVADGDPAPMQLIRVDLASGKIQSVKPGLDVGRLAIEYWFTWADGRVYAVALGSVNPSYGMDAEFALG